VVTNLLVNCDRHAPGRRHRPRVPGWGPSRRRGPDAGPGLRAALGHDVLQRGVHDPRPAGSGLGLHISAQLIDREGGELDLRTVTDPRGCLATVRLPAAGSGTGQARSRTFRGGADAVTVRSRRRAGGSRSGLDGGERR
jgi:two-component system OmpR family sensor kinase